MKLSKFFERIEYEGYTLEELEAAAGGGGGKTGGDQIYTPPTLEVVMPTTPEIEPVKTLSTDDMKKQLGAVDKSKMGTRGLKIPLTADKAPSTGKEASPATTGIQI